jgi:hypothetical protein
MGQEAKYMAACVLVTSRQGVFGMDKHCSFSGTLFLLVSAQCFSLTVTLEKKKKKKGSKSILS